MKKRSTTQAPLTVVMASSEVTPFSKTGGLADVTGALPIALAASGVAVHLFTPLYGTVKGSGVPIPDAGLRINVPVSSRQVEGKIITLRHRGVNIHFVDNDHYFNRDQLYNTPAGDYPDNLERFAFFSRAVMESLDLLKIRPDILHAHDWQTALIPVYQKTLYQNSPALQATKSFFTIHNLGYQGVFGQRAWHLTGLDWSLFDPDNLEAYDQINLLKGAILYADKITTVSPTYATEITTPDMGFGLDGILRRRLDSFTGLINGIDTNVWNPATDPLIAATYSSDDISGKALCKDALRAEFRLAPSKGPLFGVVSRLAEQKGFDLLLPLVETMVAKGAQLALVGTGESYLEDAFTKLAGRWPDAVAVRLTYDERLAHMIEAGADIFLMPSRYEPCGLNQLYSLRYGTAPIVRATGGLNDTVTPFDPATGVGTGFTFYQPTEAALHTEILRAMNLYQTDRHGWNRMISNGMSEDFSWNHSAHEYLKLYADTVDYE